MMTGRGDSAMMRVRASKPFMRGKSKLIRVLIADDSSVSGGVVAHDRIGSWVRVVGSRVDA